MCRPGRIALPVVRAAAEGRKRPGRMTYRLLDVPFSRQSIRSLAIRFLPTPLLLPFERHREEITGRVIASVLRPQPGAISSNLPHYPASGILKLKLFAPIGRSPLE